MTGEPDVLARVPGATGGELVLRRVGGHFEIISNGVFLMDTRDGRSERELVRAALAPFAPDAAGLRVLIGGLGVGFSARRALDDPRVSRVDVVELEPEIIGWHDGPLAAPAGRVLDDPRCHVHCADLVAWLETGGDHGDRYHAICLDTDNGPEWTVTEGNARLYRAPMLRRLRSLTAPGGVLAVWSAAPAPTFVRLLRRCFDAVDTVTVAVARGEPDVIYLARVEPGQSASPLA